MYMMLKNVSMVNPNIREYTKYSFTVQLAKKLELSSSGFDGILEVTLPDDSFSETFRL
jgi:hypothetical protein